MVKTDTGVGNFLQLTHDEEGGLQCAELTSVSFYNLSLRTQDVRLVLRCVYITDKLV